MKRNTMNFKTAYNKSNLLILISFIFVAVLGTANPIWAQNVFIDPNAMQDGNGSYSFPHNSWNNVQFTSSDDYYQKCNTSATISDAIIISVSGSSGDNIIIGAYYDNDGSPAYGVSGEKPILIKSNQNGNLLKITGNYINIKNMDLRRADRTVWIEGNYNTLENTSMGAGADYGGLRINGGSYNTITGCIIDSDFETYGDMGNDGFHLTSGASNNVLRYSTIDSWEHAGIKLDTCNGNLIYENVISNDSNSGGGSLQTNYSANNNQIFRNKILNMGDYFQIGGGEGNLVHNNFFDGGCLVGTGDCDLEINDPLISMRAHSAAIRNNKIYNNYIKNAPERGILLYGDNTDYELSGNEITGNIVYLKGGDNRAITISSSVGYNSIKDNEIFSENGSVDIQYRNDGLLTVDEFNTKQEDDISGNIIISQNELPALQLQPPTLKIVGN